MTRSPREKALPLLQANFTAFPTSSIPKKVLQIAGSLLPLLFEQGFYFAQTRQIHSGTTERLMFQALGDDNMRRSLMTLALAGLFGALLTAGEAQACHKKRCTPACAPAPCVQPVVQVCQPCPPPCPPPVCEPVCAPAPKRCGLVHRTGCGHQRRARLSLCHKKPACPPAPCAAPVVYAAPIASPQASGQIHASGQ
jgi:hypothetical protein